MKISGEVIEHANASFSFTEDIDWYVHDVSFEANSGIQTFNVWIFNYGYDGSQSLLEIDDVTVPDPPILFDGLSTTTVGSIPVLMGFEIDTNTPQLSVISPNENTVYLPGTSIQVEWDATDDNLVDNSIKIERLI